MFEITQGAAVEIPVVLVDATDRVTEEIGITSPTVYYAKNGGAATQLATPGWEQLSATYMPGVYHLACPATMTDTPGALAIVVTKTGCAAAKLCLDVKPARLTAQAVWEYATRTVTSFGTLATDTATAVWAAGTRTLSSFGTLVANIVTAILDADVTTHLGANSVGLFLSRLYRRFFGKVVNAETQIQVYAHDGTTPDTTMAITRDATTVTKAAAS